MKTTASIVAVLLPLCMAAFGAVEAEGSETSIKPAVSVSEEYDDNIFLSPSDRVTDYISRVIPSVKFSYKAPLWDWDIAYAYDYRYYAKKDMTDSAPRLNLSNRTNIVKEFLLLDVRDDFERTSLTPVRDFTKQSIFVNQTDTNTFSASPYILLRPSTDTSVKAGYQYRSVWYKDPASVDKKDQSGYADATWETSPRTTLTSGVRYTRTDTDKVNYFTIDTTTGAWKVNYRRADLSIGAKYEYAEGSFLNFAIGNTWFSPENPPRGVTWSASEAPPERVSQIVWNFEVIRKFLSYTLSFTTALTYVDDPLQILRREDRYMVSFKKETERLKLEASAGLWEYRQVSTNYLQDIKYETTASFGYSFTPALKLKYDLTIDRFEDWVVDPITSTNNKVVSSTYLNGIRLDHPLSESATVSLDYRYTNNYAPERQRYTENYYNNRVMVELTKQF